MFVELWENRYKKVVQAQYTDDTLEHYWEDTINEAMALKDAHPKKP